MTRAPRILALFALTFALGECLSPTEITVVISTDIACASITSTLIVVGPPDSLETRAPSASAMTCDANGNIGSLVIIPNNSSNDPVAFAVIAGINVDSEQCRATNYASCVAARRSLSFIPHTPLTLPIKLSHACIGMACTTVDGKVGTCEDGACVPATVDPTGCETAQGCVIDASAPDASDGGNTIDASPTVGTIDRLVAGGDATCARRQETSGARWYCWGGNAYGALTSTDTIITTPTYIPSLDGFDRIAIGFTHGCGIQSGAMECWGGNAEGQLGDGTIAARLTPKAVSGAFGAWTDVAVGDTHSCGTNGASIYCWGDDATGESGVAPPDAGTTIESPNLAGVSKTFTAPWSSLSAGSEFSCVIGHSQTVATVGCWGNDANDELGSEGADFSSIATTFSAPTNILAASAQTACSADDKTVTCWGANTSFAGGVSSSGNITPTVVMGISGATALARGSAHTCAIVASGTLIGEILCWGEDQNGELGRGTTGPATPTPGPVTSLSGMPVLIAAGNSHTCVVLDGTTIACWGLNTSSQLGDGTMDLHATPVTLFF